MSIAVPRGSPKFGGGGSGYSSLFRVGAGSKGRTAQSGYNWNANIPHSDFARRFGMAQTIERNQNLIDVLNDPQGALQGVNNDIYNMTVEKSGRYQDYLDDLRNLGFAEEAATEWADIMIGREIENDIFLLNARKPYAIGGAASGGWNPTDTILQNNAGMRKFVTTNKAIASSNKMGLGPGKKIKKKLKRKLRGRYGGSKK